MTALGLDFGTTNTVIAVPGENAGENGVENGLDTGEIKQRKRRQRRPRPEKCRAGVATTITVRNGQPGVPSVK